MRPSEGQTLSQIDKKALVSLYQTKSSSIYSAINLRDLLERLLDYWKTEESQLISYGVSANRFPYCYNIDRRLACCLPIRNHVQHTKGLIWQGSHNRDVESYDQASFVVADQLDRERIIRFRTQWFGYRINVINELLQQDDIADPDCYRKALGIISYLDLPRMRLLLRCKEEVGGIDYKTGRECAEGIENSPAVFWCGMTDFIDFFADIYAVYQSGIVHSLKSMSGFKMPFGKEPEITLDTPDYLIETSEATNTRLFDQLKSIDDLAIKNLQMIGSELANNDIIGLKSPQHIRKRMAHEMLRLAVGTKDYPFETIFEDDYTTAIYRGKRFHITDGMKEIVLFLLTSWKENAVRVVHESTIIEMLNITNARNDLLDTYKRLTYKDSKFKPSPDDLPIYRKPKDKTWEIR